MNRKTLFIQIGLLYILLQLILIVSIPILLFAFGFIYLGFLILLFFYLLNFLTIYLILNNSNSDLQIKVSWSMAIFLLPGAEAYLYFIVTRIPRRIKRKVNKLDLLKNDIQNSNFDNSHIEFISSGVDKLDILLSELNKAKDFINIQYFILSEGLFLDNILLVLEKKAKEGVNINIIIDSAGSLNLSNKKIREISKMNIKILIFNKINFFRPNGYMNFRSHNKFIIIDNKIGFMGGINIGDEYLSLNEKYGHWFDNHYICQGELVHKINEIFCLHWFIITNKNIFKKYKKVPYLKENKINNIEIINDFPTHKNQLFYNNLIKKIKLSTKSIKIITPYVIAPFSFKVEIRRALQRGVKVEIITTGLADKKSSFYMTGFDLDILNEIGVNIYKLNNSYVHSKIYLFDEKEIIIGSSNLDKRSIFLHYETNLILNNEPKINKKIIDYFNFLKERSTIHTTYRYNWDLFRIISFYLTRTLESFF